ncbi:MAG: SpoIID/LytB domain-containing protein, partial [Planctomycetota bacterium]
MNGGRRPGRAALLRGAPSGHGGLRPPLRRTLLPVALPLLLFLWARPALANDGPIVGVLLARGEADLAVGSPQQALRVEAEGLFETLPRGLHTLQFAGAISGIGSLRFAARPFRFRAGAGEPTQVGDRRYEGWIEVLPGKTGKGDARRWRVVNRLPLEQYLLGVLPREMSASTFPAAALEAQAIAARTYALYHIFTSPRGERVHLRADSRSQVYGGRDPHPAVTRAVERTRG